MADKTPSQILQELKAALGKGTSRAKLYTVNKSRAASEWDWSKLDGRIEIPEHIIEDSANILLESIKKSTLEFFTKAGHTGWNEDGTSNIYDSYRTEIDSRDGSIKLVTDWEGFQFPDASNKTALRAGEYGTVVAVATPFKLDDGITWVHPSFAKKNFVQKGLNDAKGKIMQIVTQHLKNILSLGDPLK
jgi:hypothetical protein